MNHTIAVQDASVVRQIVLRMTCPMESAVSGFGAMSVSISRAWPFQLSSPQAASGWAGRACVRGGRVCGRLGARVRQIRPRGHVIGRHFVRLALLIALGKVGAPCAPSLTQKPPKETPQKILSD